MHHCCIITYIILLYMKCTLPPPPSLQAKRSGVECVVVPEANQSDFEDLPDFIKQGLEVHFVKHYAEVYSIIFPQE